MAISEETRTRLAACSSATLSTQLFKRGLRNQLLQGVSRLTPKAPPMVGEAFTLRNIPAREDIDHIGVYEDPEHPQRKAIETAPPGCSDGMVAPSQPSQITSPGCSVR